jgi:hypothetical protein
LKNTEVVTEVRGEASRRPRQWIAKEQLIEKVKGKIISMDVSFFKQFNPETSSTAIYR